MYFSCLLLAGFLVSVSQAQTPSGFTPSVSNHLTVMFNSTAVSPAGIKLSKATTVEQPTIGISGISTSGTFMFVILDIDVSPSESANTTRRTLLHAMNTGFKASTSRTTASTTTLQSADTRPASYIGPSPPIETPAFGHRYVQLLFAQPTNFAVPASQASAVKQRIGFDIVSFMADAGLAAPVAANFFVVVGEKDAGGSASAAAGGTAAATGSGGMSTSTLEPFQGSAGKFDMAGSGLWAALLGLGAAAYL